MKTLPPPGAVLLLVDLQRAIDDPSWGERNNPDAEANITRLLAHWRKNGWPVWHVRHDSDKPHAGYRPGQPLHDFKPEAQPVPGEPIIGKHTNSAFIGTDLDALLLAAGFRSVVIAGVATNNCVEATVRMAGNLGFDTYLIADGCFAFGRKDWTGKYHPADDVHAMSLGNLDGEYCTVIRTHDALTDR